MVKKLLFLLLLFPIVACAQGTFTAATCNSADVNAVINGPTHTAVAGDTIIIPNGTCTWSATQALVGGSNLGSPCITIQGQSQTGTILVTSSTGGFINTGNIPTIAGCLTRLTNMTMNPAAGLGRGQILQFTGTCSSTTCPNIRVDHITFGSATNGWPQGIADWMVLTINCFGVIDHNTAFAGSTGFPAGSPWFAAGYPAYLGVQGSSGLLCNAPYGGCGDNSLAQPDNWGSANMLYIEDNNLTFLKGHGWLTDCTNAGCRFVIRFNTINEGNATGHGTETQSRNRTVRAVEMYGNTFTIGALCTGSVHVGDAGMFVSRGGTMLGWGNTGSGFCGTNIPEQGVIELQTFRVGGGGPYHNWANCDGTSPFDTNDAPTGVPAVSSSDTLTSVSGNVLGTTKTYTANQFAPGGNNYFTLFDANRGVVYDIVSNTANTITVDHAYGAQVGSAAAGDTYYVAATKFNFLGTNSTTSTTGVLTDSGSPGWTPNQWIGYSVHDITQFWGNTVISNTANTITFHHTDPNSGGNVSINAGDKYTITRATVCSDQNGRGQGVYFGGAFAQNPVQAANQALSPVYEWMDTFQGSPAIQPTATVYVSNGGGNPSLPPLSANRDWFANTVNQTAQTSTTSPFNGTSGTGYGTLANRPGCISPACTTNVGYFATDQGSWNTAITSSFCVPSSNCKGFNFGSGVFYIWNGSAWITYYTPLTYPHPLITGSAPPAGPTGSLSPTSLNFGNQIVGTNSTTQSFTFTNNGPGSLTISTITLAGDYSQTNNCPFSGFSMAAGTSCTFNVTFSPTIAGSRPGSITITSNATNSPSVENLSGTGVVTITIENGAIIQNGVTITQQASVVPSISFVGSVGGQVLTPGATTVASSSGLNTSSGDLIVVTVRQDTDITAPSSVTDTAGNTYTHYVAADSSIDSSDLLTEWYSTNSTSNGSNVVTAHWSASHTFTSVVARDYSVTGTPSTDGATPSTNTSCGVTITSSSFNTTGSVGVIIFALTTGATNQTFTAGSIGGSSATNLAVDKVAGSTMTTSEDLIVSTPQSSITASMTQSAANNHCEMVPFAFKVQ